MGLSVAEKIRLIMKRQKITMGDLAEASGQTRQNPVSYTHLTLPTTSRV